jgi:hypothetical protein
MRINAAIWDGNVVSRWGGGWEIVGIGEILYESVTNS